MKSDVFRSRPVKPIFVRARRITNPIERQTYLAEACGEDLDLRTQVESLLAALDRVPCSPLDKAMEKLGSAKTGFLDMASDEEIDISSHPTVGPYKLLEQIGEGGMGTVFMAQQKQPVKRNVALKLIKPGMDSKEVVARFEAERQALAMMDHSSIARIFDGGLTEQGRPYFVMELVRGLPIDTYCDEATLPLRDRLKLFMDVCRAVQHAHHKGIIHRDLKPSNILITLHDTVPVVKVIDFGVAKALEHDLTERTLFTRFTELVGTPVYMSPEQAEMSGLDIDTRSDVYSLGVLLYKLLVGVTPFDESTLKSAGLDEMRRVIREDEPFWPSHRVITLDNQLSSTISGNRATDSRALSLLMRRELDWIVMKALEKDRDRRYQSASDLALDVQRYLDDEPVVACPPSTTYRFRKFARRNKTAIATTGLVAVALIIGTSVSVWQASQANDARKLSEERLIEVDEQRQNAVRAAQLAQQNEEFSRQLVYAADVKLAAQAWKSEDVRRFTDLLDRHTQIAGKTDLRGFEWRYLRQFGTASFHNIATQTGGSCVVRYSPDGKYLITGQHDGTLCVRDGLSFEHLDTLSGHDGLARGIDFAPDGIHMASIGDDGMIRLWDLSVRKQIHRFPAHPDHGYRVFFVMDGQLLASCGNDSSVRLWNASTGEALSELKGYVHRKVMDRSPDGRLCASDNPDGAVYVWDVQTHKQLRRIDLGLREGVRCHARCVCFSPDGRFVAIGTDENLIRFCDAQTGTQIATFTGHDDDIQDITFHPSGGLLASSDMAGVIRVWPLRSFRDVADHEFVRTEKWPPYFQGHTARAWSLDFSPDGTRLVSASKDGTVRSWSARDQIRQELVGTVEANSVVFASHGSDLLIAGGNNIRTWSRQANEIRQIGETFNEAALCVAVSPDGEICVTGHKEGVIRFWRYETSRLIKALTVHDDNVDHLAFSPDGRMLATASWDGTAQLLDTDSGKQLAVFDMQQPHCYDVAFSPNGRLLACSSEDDAMLFDVASQKRLHLLRGHQNTAQCVAFSPDGRLLATGSWDRTIRLWNVDTGEVKHVISAQGEKIYSLAFSPDGRTIASGGEKGTIAFSHVETGQFLFGTRVGKRKIRSLQFSPDGKILAATVNDEGVILLHARRTETTDLVNPGHVHPFQKFPRESAEIKSSWAVDSTFASNTNDDRAEFLGLGLLSDDFSDSYAQHVSTDGSVVIGYCQDSNEQKQLFRWEQDTGLREVVTQRGNINGLNDDGSILYGGTHSSKIFRAAIWKSTSEFTFLPESSTRRLYHSECEAASADGSILVGWHQSWGRPRRALRWTGEGVEELAPVTADAWTKTMATAVSATGAIIVGVEWTGPGLSDSETRSRPVRWTSSGVELLPGFDPAYNWFVKDISSDGSVVVGMRWPAGNNGPWTGPTAAMAFLWENGTITLLGDIYGGDIYSIASEVSDDGRIVVGISHGAGRSIAFVWDAAHGLRSLESVLWRYGVVLLNWRIEEAVSVSGDGRTVVGWGLRENGHREAWLARLPKQTFALP